MKVTVLSDDIGSDSLKSEWGLSFHIEFNDRKYLLDTGASDAFIENASTLGLDISDVDCAILSHAHYDHSLGMESFLKINGKAPFHISANVGENCYSGRFFTRRYIGIPKGVLERYPDRFVRHDGVSSIDRDVYLVSHSTPGLSRLGLRNRLYVRRGPFYYPDDFAHEQTLVFNTDKGLVLFNSCTHSGPGVVFDEVLSAFPGRQIYAFFGGLHLFRSSDSEIRTVSRQLAESQVKHIFTGHCTGEHAFTILSEELGSRLEQFHSGWTTD